MTLKTGALIIEASYILKHFNRAVVINCNSSLDECEHYVLSNKCKLGEQKRLN